MASRMEKYYEQNIKTKKRTIKNVDLYKSIYETGEYSNIEGIATIEKTNEIDISKIQELLKKREEEEKQSVIPIVKKERHIYKEEEEEEEKNYDIRDVLNKAKNEKEPDNKARKLRNTQYNILKNINLQDLKEKENTKDLEKLVNTMTSTDLISKLGDDELSLDVLNNFKTETIPKTEESKEEMSLDKSFFTSSLNFGKDDFEEISDMNKSIKKNNKLIKILVFILILLIIASIAFIFFILK